MHDDERVIAEQVVSLHEQKALTVRISQSRSEEFWRVDVAHSASLTHHASTTVPPGDSFMMKLIEDAVSGEQVAWRHLAQWGHSNLTRASGPRAAWA